eukprot:jgi/Bigna1/33998/e_gw1.4.172.1
MFWRTNLKLTGLLLLEIGTQIMQVLLLRWVLLFIQQDNEGEVPIGSVGYGYGYAAALGVSALMIGCIHHQIFYGGVQQGINVRAGVSCMLFEKSLRLGNAAMKENTQGRVLNLVTTDAMRFIEMFKFVNFLVAVPLLVVAVVGLMVWNLGPVSLVSILILLLWTPVQVYFARSFATVRRRAVQHTDVRIKMIGEALHAGTTMKMYSWEQPLVDACDAVRAHELGAIAAAARLKSVNLGMFICCTTVCIVPTLLIIVFIEGRSLTVADVFTLVAFFNVLRFPVGFVFPLTLQLLSEALVSIERINAFLRAPECQGLNSFARASSGEKKDALDEDTTIALDAGSVVETANLVGGGGSRSALIDGSSSGVGVGNGAAARTANKKGHAAPPSGDEKGEGASTEVPPNDVSFSLSRLSMRLRSGKLYVIAGGIGSGKSSFLQSLLGEMSLVCGHARVTGSVAYVPQRPWIFSASVRENILFGLPFESEWYRRGGEAGSLSTDFHSFPYAHFTIARERGVSLNGGQPARIALARTGYPKPERALAEDPLSPVDYHVAQNIFAKCFGPDSSCLRVLVTHHVHFAKHAEEVVIMKRGRISHQAPFDALDWTAPELAKLRITQTEEKEEGKKESKSNNNNNQARAAKKEQPLSSADLQMGARKQSIIVDEKQDEGAVSLKSYDAIPTATGNGARCIGYTIWILLLSLMMAGQALITTIEVMLGEWARADAEDQRGSFWPTLMISLLFSAIVIAISRSLALFETVLHASRNLHRSMLMGVVLSPSSWLQSQPVGRVLNRFSQDTATVDELFPLTLHDFLQCSLLILAAGVLLFAASWWMLLFLAPTVPLFLRIRRKYVASSRELKRLDGTTRSPQYAHFGATLQGLSTIRAFGRGGAFLSEFYELVDANCRTTIIFEAAARWLAFRLDMLAALFVISAPILFVALRESIDPALAGVALVYAIGMNALFPWMVRQSAEVENLMTSVERIYEYTQLKREEPLPSQEVARKERELAEREWPQKGHIEFRGLRARYGATLPLVLKSLSFTIKAGEVVGICGRSGSGKSTLFGVLFRLLDKECISGGYLIDGEETGALPLSSLRRRLSVVPQEPVLMSGSLRYNLDPFDVHSDEEIVSALKKVGLEVGMSQELDQIMAEFGTNLSVGESQLLCVARALLQPSKILLIDEATAHVDAHTDTKIQKVLRSEFKGRTILIIAHRLHTIMHCDRVMVIDKGDIVEFDNPATLLKKEASIL